MAEGGGLDHDDEVMAFCVDAYMGYVRGLALSIEDVEDEVSQHEQSLSLMGVDYSRGGSAGAKADCWSFASAFPPSTRAAPTTWRTPARCAEAARTCAPCGCTRWSAPPTPR